MSCSSVAGRTVFRCSLELPDRLCVYAQRTRETLSSGQEFDHSLQSSLKFKNAWSYTSFTPYAFKVWAFIKHRDVFILVDQHAEFSRTGEFSFYLRLPENESEKSVTHGTN